MVFGTGNIRPYYAPPSTFNNTQLKDMEKVKFLGRILTSDLNDDLDLERERRALAV